MIAIEFILYFLILGSVVGVLAGLLGIGGGGIMVPILTTIFISQGVELEKVVHIALGTSMASIIVTSFSSMRAHNLKAAVNWKIVKEMAPGVIIGSYFGTYLVSFASSIYLALFFSLFMAYIAIQMFLNTQLASSRSIIGKTGQFIAGTAIGSVSALVSIGGGSLTVPYLSWQKMTIQKAIATSATIGFPLSIAGSIGYVLNGWSNTSIENFTLGFVYLPAVLFISIASFITAPYGVNLAHKLPIAKLKKIFSLLLIILSIKMLYSILF